MVIASAGVLLDDEVINSNLPWRISLTELRRDLHLRELHVVNDFAAAAHGTGRLAAGESRLLTPDVARPSRAGAGDRPRHRPGCGDLHPAGRRRGGAADRSRHGRVRARQRPRDRDTLEEMILHKAAICTEAGKTIKAGFE